MLVYLPWNYIWQLPPELRLDEQLKSEKSAFALFKSHGFESEESAFAEDEKRSKRLLASTRYGSDWTSNAFARGKQQIRNWATGNGWEFPTTRSTRRPSMRSSDRAVRRQLRVQTTTLGIDRSLSRLFRLWVETGAATVRDRPHDVLGVDLALNRQEVPAVFHVSGLLDFGEKHIVHKSPVLPQVRAGREEIVHGHRFHFAHDCQTIIIVGGFHRAQIVPDRAIDSVNLDINEPARAFVCYIFLVGLSCAIAVAIQQAICLTCAP